MLLENIKVINNGLLHQNACFESLLKQALTEEQLAKNQGFDTLIVFTS